MKSILISLIIAAAAFYYFYSGGKNSYPQKAKASDEAAIAPTRVDTAVVESNEEEDPVEQPKRQVQIHGKWYDYRRDNTYMINGVPTLHIPQAPPPKEMIKTQVVAIAKGQAANQPDTDPAEQKPSDRRNDLMAKPGESQAKSQKLLDMADKNPLGVYSPGGFQTLKDGVDAAKNAQHERAKALEEASEGD